MAVQQPGNIAYKVQQAVPKPGVSGAPKFHRRELNPAGSSVLKGTAAEIPPPGIEPGSST